MGFSERPAEEAAGEKAEEGRFSQVLALKPSSVSV